jgi:HlyD family secretion protein
VLRNGEAVSVDVKIGAANDRVTEIVGGEIEAGTEIITEFLDTTP